MPVKENESLTNILQKLGHTINKPITAADIEVCHRVPVPHSDTNKNIVVQLVRRAKRNAVLEKVHKHGLTCQDLGLASTMPKYVNEHLCSSGVGKTVW